MVVTDSVRNEFNGALLPFQKQGVDIIQSTHDHLLGDQAGVGKTPQAIFLTKDSGKVLVLTLATLKFQFQNELAKFLPTATSVVVNGSSGQRAALWASNVQYYIANYELLIRDLGSMNRPWDWIIADECTKLSNPTNKSWINLQKLSTRRRLPMTGTAISNSPLDAYGIFEWVKPKLFGNYYAFLERYCIRVPLPSGGKMIVGFRNEDELAEKIKPYYIRRTKEQVLPELPEKIQIEVPFELSKEERKLYDQIRSRMLLSLKESDVSKIENLSHLDSGVVNMIRLRQIACSPELIGEMNFSSKLKTLKELIETL